MTPPGAAGNDPRGQASSRRRDGIRRRDELLDAALACFSQRGLLGTRIEDIRRAAGASPSSVYNLFDGLPSLTAALLARTFERLFAHVTSGAEAVAAAPGTDLVPVLKQRHEAVDHAVDEMFGDSLLYDRGSRATDEEGWASGLAAADMAVLNNREQVSA